MIKSVNMLQGSEVNHSQQQQSDEAVLATASSEAGRSAAQKAQQGETVVGQRSSAAKCLPANTQALQQPVEAHGIAAPDSMPQPQLERSSAKELSLDAAAQTQLMRLLVQKQPQAAQAQSKPRYVSAHCVTQPQAQLTSAQCLTQRLSALEAELKAVTQVCRLTQTTVSQQKQRLQEMAEAEAEGKQKLAMKDSALKCYREQAQQLTNELADNTALLEALAAQHQALVASQQQPEQQQQQASEVPSAKQQATHGSNNSLDAPGGGSNHHGKTAVELAKRLCEQLQAEHNSAVETQQRIKQLQEQVASLRQQARVKKRAREQARAKKRVQKLAKLISRHKVEYKVVKQSIKAASNAVDKEEWSVLSGQAQQAVSELSRTFEEEILSTGKRHAVHVTAPAELDNR